MNKHKFLPRLGKVLCSAALVAGVTCVAAAPSVALANVGSGWTEVGAMLPPQEVDSIASASGTLYALQFTPGSVLSQFDNGVWSSVPGAPNGIESVTSDSTTLYVGTSLGVESYQPGGSWTALAGGPTGVKSVQDLNGKLYAISEDTSTDEWSVSAYDPSNQTWTTLGQPMQGVGALYAVAVGASNKIYVGGPNGVYAFNASSNSWPANGMGAITMTGSPMNVYSMVYNAGTLYVGVDAGGNETSGEVYTFDGTTWTQLTSAPANVHSMVFVSGTLYAGGYRNSSADIYQLNSNNTWTEMPNSPEQIRSMIAVNGTLYVSDTSYTDGVSMYDGTQWSYVGNPEPTYADVFAELNGTLYAGTNSGSDDVWEYSGSRWVDLPKSPASISWMAVANGKLYASDSNNHIWSYDGSMWIDTGTINVGGNVQSVDSMTSMGGTLYVATGSGTNDVWALDGSTWTQMPHSPGSPNQILGVGDLLYAATNTGSGSDVWVYNPNDPNLSTDGGWSNVSRGPSAVEELASGNGVLYALSQISSSSQEISAYANGAWNTLPSTTQSSAASLSTSGMVTVDGELFVPTYDASAFLLAYSPVTKAWTSFPMPDAASRANITGLFSDGSTLYASINSSADTVFQYGGFLQETTASLPDGTVGSPYSSTLTAAGGSGTYTWSLIGSSTLPNGLSLDGSTGVISGTPTTAGNSSFTVQVTDGTEVSTATLSITVNAAPNIGTLTIVPSSNTVTSGQSVSVTGVVYGVNGSPAVNTQVDLTTSGGALATATEMTDNHGGYSDTWTAPTVATQTPFTVTASVYGTNVTNQATITVNPIGQPGGSGSGSGSGNSGSGSGNSGSGSGNSGSGSGSSGSGSGSSGSGSGSSGSGSGSSGSGSGNSGSGSGSSGSGSGSSGSGSGNSGSGSSNGGSGSGNGGSSSSNGGSGNSNGSGAPKLPTVLASQTFDSTGGQIVKSVGSMTVNVSVPQGAMSGSEQLTLTTGTAPNVTQLVNGLSTHAVATVFGVSFSGPPPTKPVTVTITDPNISPDGLLYKLTSSGQLVPLVAKVSAGQVVVSFTSDPDFVVLNVNSDQRVITLAGHAVIVPGMVKSNGGPATTYMPIWYVMQLLKELDISSTWDGHNWRMSTSGETALSTLNPGKGTMHIFVNGELVQNLTGEYVKGPNSRQATTYMPIWFVMQVLKQLGIQSTWNGHTWTLSQHNN